MKIPYHQNSFDQEEMNAVQRVMQSGWITTGPESALFEQEFSEYKNSKLSIAVNSCTAALHLILASLKLSSEDEVITTAFTFAASANIILHNGAKVVFADVCEETLNIDVEDVRRKINPKTKAIIVVHFAGHLCDMDAFMQLSQETGIPIIEDCAHALESKWNGIPSGLIGYAGAFSFYANKNMTCGEGGMIISKHVELKNYFLSMRNHGFDIEAYSRMANSGFKQYDIISAGFKYNLPDIPAAIARVQLSKIEQMREKRLKIVERYIEAFEKNKSIKIIKPLEKSESAWHLFVIQLDTNNLKITRNECIQKMIENGVQVSVHFKPVHQMSLYKNLQDWHLPNTEKAGNEVVSLPLYPNLTLEQQDYIIKQVNLILK